MTKKEDSKIMENFFSPKSVAIVGVSATPNKLGHVIFRNFLKKRFKGKYYPVNPKEKEIMGQKVYSSVSDIPDKIDLVIIATPASTVIPVIEDCAKKGVKNVVMITAGFEEVGNFKLRDELKRALDLYGIRVIGPNCLGVYDSNSGLDTLFLPEARLTRPNKGDIAFLCQSGSAGAALVDTSGDKGIGFSKFISYGNALNVDETDLIEYLGDDPKTKVIALFCEGVKDGKKFLRVVSQVSKKKPIVVMKGGMTAEGSTAILSHTGALAGTPEVYSGAFKQAGIIQVDSIEELFSVSFALATTIKPKGKRVQVITNGGGYGVLTTDAIIKNSLTMAVMTDANKKRLKEKFADIAIIKNPIDLTGGGTDGWFKDAIDAAVGDQNVDIIIAITLYQTPLVTQQIGQIILKAKEVKQKPIFVIGTGKEFARQVKPGLEQNGVPVFEYPEKCVKTIRYFTEYHKTN
jgi:acetyl coenzyme A synthetase (ADP forming)-like protein